jgi:hypothetical protein
MYELVSECIYAYTRLNALVMMQQTLLASVHPS